MAYEENPQDIAPDQAAAETQGVDPRDTNSKTQAISDDTAPETNAVQSGQEAVPEERKKEKGAPEDVLKILDGVHQHFGVKGMDGAVPDEQGGKAPAGPEKTETDTGTTYTSPPPSQAAEQAIPDEEQGAPSPFGGSKYSQQAGQQEGAGSRFGSAVIDGIKRMFSSEGAESPLKAKQDEDRIKAEAPQIDAHKQDRPGIWTPDEVKLEALRRAAAESEEAARAKMQGYRDQHTTFRGIAEHALDKGDREAAAKLADRAHQFISDGKSMTTTPIDGGFLVTVSKPSHDPNTIGTPADVTAQSFKLTDNQMREFLHGAGGQFDVLHHNGLEESLKGIQKVAGRGVPTQYMNPDEAKAKAAGAAQPGFTPGANPNTGGGRPGESELDRLRRNNPTVELGMGDTGVTKQGQSRPYGINNKPTSTQQAQEDVRANRTPSPQPGTAGQAAPPPSARPGMENVKSGGQQPGYSTEDVRNRVFSGQPQGQAAPQPQAPDMRGGMREQTNSGDLQIDPRAAKAYPNDPEAQKQYSKMLRDRDAADVEAAQRAKPAEKPKSLRVQNAEHQDQQDEERKAAHERQQQRTQQRVNSPPSTLRTRMQRQAASQGRKIIGYRDRMTGQINYH